jgi:hypothetical protein
MLGKQLQFLLDIDTENQFVKHILSEENNRILFNGYPIAELPKPFTVEGWFTVYLYRPEFGEIVTENIDNLRSYIRPNYSPVIEFSRTIVREEKKELSKGRVWVEMKYFDKNGFEKHKPKELNDFYNNVTRWLKKAAPLQEINGSQKVHVTEKILKKIELGYKIL